MSRSCYIAFGCLLILLGTARLEAAVRVALLQTDPRQTGDLVAVVEARLSAGGKVALVERQQIDKLIAEQQLQAAFGADAVMGRVSIGKILRADLLVFLQLKDKPTLHLDLVISETHQGLRLVHRPIQNGTNVEADADALIRLVESAIEKYGQRIKEIVAVPPLVSNDLDFESQVLQRPLANVIEQSLLARPQVLAVELAEAKAVADELALNGERDIQRRLPLYLLGDFRHQEYGANARLSIHLKLMRGQKLMGERELKDVAPADVANVLRREAAAILDKALDTRVPLPDTATEARQLAQRAIAMYRLMNFYECLELAEASLLLKPDQTDIHRLAAHSAGMHVSMLLRKAAEKPLPYGVEQLKAIIRHENEATIRRGLPHLEYFMEHAVVSASRDRALILGYFEGCQEIKEIRSMMLRVLAAKRKDAVDDDTFLFLREFRKWCLNGMTVDEVMRWKLEAAQAWPKADAQGVVHLVDLMTYGTDGSDGPQLRDIVKRLQNISNPACPRAIAFMESRWSHGLRATPDVARKVARSKPVAPIVSGMEVKLIPIPVAPTAGLIGCIPASPGIDTAWTARELFIAKGKGSNTKIDSVAQIVASDDCVSVAFDGKYVWAFQNPTDVLSLGGQRDAASQPRLMVLDPVASRHWFLTTGSGLPPMTLRSVSITPLGIGKVCVVGHFGEQRMTRVWFAMASLDATTGKGSVNVFHDARDVPAVRHGDEWKNSHMAFSRGHAFTLTAPRGKDGKSYQRIVADRHYGYPLLIDPETHSVAVSPESIDCVMPGIPIQREDALYWINQESGSDKLNIDRFGFSDFKIQQGKYQVPLGRLAYCRQWSVLLDNDGEIWIAADPQGPFRRFRTVIPTENQPHRQDMRIFASQRSDLLVYIPSTGRLLEVVLPPDKSLESALGVKRGAR